MGRRDRGVPEAVRFRIREGRPWEVATGDPRTFTLEVTQGNVTSCFQITPEDIAALSSVALQYNSKASMPIEAGEP